MLKKGKRDFLLIAVLAAATLILAGLAELGAWDEPCDLLHFRDTCDIGCPLGYANNESGCPVCECLDSELELPNGCPASLGCDRKCENYVVGDDGCVTCECSDPDELDPARENDTACDIAGFKADCTIGCPLGYVNDENGCPVCECNSPPGLVNGCPASVNCAHKCEDYFVNKNGCVTCRCADPDQRDPARENEKACNINRFNASCAIGCPLGYAGDEDGCPVCECFDSGHELPNGCPGVLTCEQRCEDYAVGDDGCVTCECG